MNADNYTTLELIEEIERQVAILSPKPGAPHPTLDLMRVAATRLRQYQWMDKQRVITALATVKRCVGA